ncbi:MAG: hypothetical protein DRJ65_16205 [Acidobacteria bacterium]|nr:MAG: hypothetical protein DRJ65_16205 [Acidobacteriota bacterium]
MGWKRQFSMAAVAGLWAVGIFIPSQAECQWRPTRHFTVRDGLVQSQISGLAQDADGYIWVATQGGLCRFDGQTFRRFTRADGLPDNVINAVDAKGSDAWIATELAGVALWDGASISTIPDLPLPQDQRLSGIQVMPDGTILVSSAKGILAYQGNQWTLIDESPAFGLIKGFGNRVIALGRAPLGIDSSLEPSPLLELNDDQRLVAASENSDHLWIAVLRNTLGLIQRDDIVWMTPDIEGEIITLLADEQGSGLWIGTDEGLWRRHENGVIEEILLQPREHRLQISTLLKDREGNVWVGTWGAGLFQIPPTPWTLFTRETGFPAHSAWAFSEGQDGCIWMATSDGGVVSWCGDHWGATLGSEDGLPSDAVFTLSHDTEGALWVGTYHGVCRRTESNLQCWGIDDGLRNDFIRHLIPRKAGGMWMATDEGLAMWDGSQWHFWGQEEGLPGTLVRSLAEDSDGRVWMALDAVGVASFDGTSFTLFNEDDGLPTNRVWTLGLSSRGRLLVGTDVGLWIRDVNDDGPGMVIGIEDGLPSESVIAVTEDLNGRIWAGTTHGVSVISPDGEVLRTFSAHEGLSDTEAAEGASWRDSHGRLWLGMAYGVTVVDPSLLSRNLVAPEVVLENARSNGRTHPEFHVISTTGENDTLALRIDPSITHLRFDYAAPSFVAPELVRFRLALTCFSDQFSPPSSDRHITYHALPAGKYRFGIQAVNNDGVPSAKTLWVDLDVRPPWYRTRWFQFFAILSAALLGAGILHLRDRGRLKRKAWLEEEVKQRTSDLDSANQQIQEQNRQLTELSRTDPLTGLGNRRALTDVLPVEMSILKREVIRLGPSDNIGDYHAAVIMMIDLDHFKAVNDRWGHDVGDQALKRCGNVLSDEMRECDQAVRWGGEEFVILARGMDRKGTLLFAQRILDRFNKCHLEGPDGIDIPIRASFGFLQIPLGTTDFQLSDQWPRLVDLADRLMYRAKEKGRARSIGLVWRDGGLPRVSAKQNCETLLRDIEAIPEAMELVELKPSVESD